MRKQTAYFGFHLSKPLFCQGEQEAGSELEGAEEGLEEEEDDEENDEDDDEEELAGSSSSDSESESGKGRTGLNPYCRSMIKWTCPTLGIVILHCRL